MARKFAGHGSAVDVVVRASFPERRVRQNDRTAAAAETGTRRRYRPRGVGRRRAVQATPTVRHWSSPQAG